MKKGLLRPGSRSGGEVQTYVFDRATFQRVSVADLSPGGRYVLGVVRAGEVIWETDFDPEAERLWLTPWAPPARPSARQPAAKPATAGLRGDVSADGRVDDEADEGAGQVTIGFGPLPEGVVAGSLATVVLTITDDLPTQETALVKALVLGGEVAGRWNSIPLNPNRRQSLELTLGGGARVVASERLATAKAAAGSMSTGLQPNAPNPFNSRTQIVFYKHLHAMKSYHLTHFCFWFWVLILSCIVLSMGRGKDTLVIRIQPFS